MRLLHFNAQTIRSWGALVCLLMLAPSVWGQVPARCTDAFQRAEEVYQEGNYQEAIRLLAPCTAQAAADRAETIGLHRLLSMAYINSGNATGAQATILDLLRLVPDYAPDPIQDPPSYAVLVTVIRDQLAEEGTASAEPPPQGPVPWTKKPTRWIALVGGLVVVGVTAMLAGEVGTGR